ncbi:MAG: dihydrolipoyl dehydrogenase [Verrucomicrobia bacterium]|nr:dihydrolipoyl dehydrogenase [Verrucomicrobiota bacterium]
MKNVTHDLVVIGAGPGGYVAALRAAQLGLKVACVEREPALGGTCLRIGCIPSKVLLESSQRYWETRTGLEPHGIRVGQVQLDLPTLLQRKKNVVQTLTQGLAGLFRKLDIARYTGHGRLIAPGQVLVEAADPSDSVQLEAQHVILATGSQPASLKGVELNGDRVGTSTQALAYPEVPRRLVVIGAGYIGLELGCVWHRLGAQVVLIEFLDRILPGIDSDLAAEAHKLFAQQGLEFRLGTRVTAARSQGDHCLVEVEGAAPIECDRVLLAVGRAPCTEGLGLDTVGIALDAQGRIPVDDHYATTVPGLYAIGDLIPGPMLAHKAEEEGLACVERIVTGYGHVDYNAIPAVVFTHPEIASVGQTEDRLKTDGVEYRKGTFPFVASGRARTLGATAGRVKVLAHAQTDRILGVHVLGPHAGELIAEAATAMTFGATSEDLARCCHAHPTLAEALKEAALAVSGRALHISTP